MAAYCLSQHSHLACFLLYLVGRPIAAVRLFSLRLSIAEPPSHPRCEIHEADDDNNYYYDRETTTSTTMTKDKPMLQHILISGGTGFVGSAIARAVAEQHPKCTITVLDRNPPNTTHALPDKMAFIQADITVPDDLYKTLEQVRPQIVVHTAGIVPELSERFGRRLEQRAWKTNVEGTRNMLGAAREAEVKAFVYTSTCCVVTDDMSMPYPNIDERWPASPSSLIYGESKVVIFSFL